ncbi:MAG: hypothetical protein ACRELD_07095 [Longimicrobiales bacterium]
MSIPLDEQGMLGRECPNEECLGYFKIEPGTGLQVEDLLCHCPYCGHAAYSDHFFTKEQIEYAQSIALREFTKDLNAVFKSLERRPRRGDWFSIGIEVDSRPYPIAHYAEKTLETVLVCDSCTLRYAIYGVFGYCPDCGVHNSLQILRTNLLVSTKMVELTSQLDATLQRAMLENALQAVVAAFDAFGRQLCQRYASRARNPTAAAAISFQSLSRAAESVEEQFGFDLAHSLRQDDWQHMLKLVQKRHLLAHRAGVVDAQYLAITRDPEAELGRKISLGASEIIRLVTCCEVAATAFHSEITRPAS